MRQKNSVGLTINRFLYELLGAADPMNRASGFDEVLITFRGYCFKKNNWDIPVGGSRGARGRRFDKTAES